MMHKLNLSLCLFILSITCYANAEQLTYNNSKFHFSFILPDGWEYINIDSLPDDVRNSINKTFKAKSKAAELKIYALCKKIELEPLKTPYILIQYRDIWKMGDVGEQTERALEETLLSDEEQKRLEDIRRNTSKRINYPESCLPKYWKGYKEVKSSFKYLHNKHVGVIEAELTNENVGKIILFNAIFLGSNRITTIRGFADGENAENFLDLMDQIIDSFSYDKGYGFGEGKGDPKGTIRSIPPRTIKRIGYVLMCTLGIAILYSVLGKWAKG